MDAPAPIQFACPFCHIVTAVLPAPLEVVTKRQNWGRWQDVTTQAWRGAPPFYTSRDGGCWWLGACQSCGKGLLVADNGSRVYPTPQPARVDPRIPEPMASDLAEAKRCMTVEAFNGAAVLARRALQSACVAHQAAGSRLIDQIDSLAEKRTITEQLRTVAHAIRVVGNEGAHESRRAGDGDTAEVSKTSRDDALRALEFAEEFCRSLYAFAPAASETLSQRGFDAKGRKPKP